MHDGARSAPFSGSRLSKQDSASPAANAWMVSDVMLIGSVLRYGRLGAPSGGGRNTSAAWLGVPVLFFLADLVPAAGTPLGFKKRSLL
jgi:hypothetical protein